MKTVVDLKLTEASVDPYSCEKRIYADYDIQAAFYLRGMDALRPDGAGSRRFLWFFGEMHEPYAISPPMQMSEAGRQMGSEKVERALKVWDQCVRTNEWPGYPRTLHIAEPPVWAMTQWEQQAMEMEGQA